MMSLKGVLKEEVDNSIRLQKRYQKELSRLPKGSLIEKNIKGRKYYYCVYRNEQGKVCFDYLGKDISEKQKNDFAEIKKKRAQCRKFIGQLNKEIKFLRKSIGGRQSV